MFFSPSLVIFVLLRASTVHASLSAPSCAATKTVATVTESAVRETYADSTKWVLKWRSTRVIQPATTSLQTVTRTSYTGTTRYSSLYTQGTRTVGAYKLVTATCTGGTYTLACPTIKTTISLTETSYAYYSTSTYFFRTTRTRDFYTTLIRKTTTTGNPPTTKIISSRITARTVTGIPVTRIRDGRTITTIISQPDENGCETTKTVSLAQPTATATISLFSLQVTNTSNEIDGYTLGQRDEYAYIQNTNSFRFYIEPGSGYLINYDTNAYLGIPEAVTEDDGDILPPLKFTPDVRHPPDCSGGLELYRALVCKGRCGDIIRCGFPPNGDYKVAFLNADFPEGALGWTYGAWDPVGITFRIVQPTQGRKS